MVENAVSTQVDAGVYAVVNQGTSIVDLEDFQTHQTTPQLLSEISGGQNPTQNSSTNVLRREPGSRLTRVSLPVSGVQGISIDN